MTSNFPPYSDFNFVSMWSWNTLGMTEISKLNGNLVVKFTDYLTTKPFYSFLGNNNVNDTARKLLDLSVEQGLEPILKLIPEDSTVGMDADLLIVQESRDHFDYILDNEILKDFSGPKLNDHASFKRRFIEALGGGVVTVVMDINDPLSRQGVVALNETWVKNKTDEKKNVFPEIEFAAIKNFFRLEKDVNRFILSCVFYKKEMIAFTIDELLKDGYSVRHFMKANSAFKGIYSYLISSSAEVLFHRGYNRTNIEQDLGLMNLRQSKKSFQPVSFLKKYTVEYNKK